MIGEWRKPGDPCPDCGGTKTEIVVKRYGEREKLKTQDGPIPGNLVGRGYTMIFRDCGNDEPIEMLGAFPFFDEVP